jgi:hypothetical protein
MSRTYDPLRQPLWWGALALLLVNDNLLKGSGLAPAWLTGKLSDFALRPLPERPTRQPPGRVVLLSIVRPSPGTFGARLSRKGRGEDQT